MSFFDQQKYDIKFEWGGNGLKELMPVSDVVIIVDIFSFTTCVDIAVARGAIIYPYWFKDQRAVKYAESLGCILASEKRTDYNLSLSPKSLMNILPGTKLVLPSPNGAILSLNTNGIPTIAGCIRNASSVSKEASALGKNISVIAAGERWKEDNSLRPAMEDLLGAGAIIASLNGSKSIEATLAEAAFLSAKHRIQKTLLDCSSGNELVSKGFEIDVKIVSEYNCSEGCPLLQNGAFSPQH